ncbi:low temperature requirement protein A [Pseudonocardia abyssalis]|uniref:Low temperature requirement protein A n=1 Tax=Pseudonocardia abyssalis TaxID=2792008 RepID=A0ABS6UZT6_9PSEU|nr:low temperature requirement protein A [Pseudonocardia abyssalis]MBW0117580.1 low temperature requirement protein A [Pseudonocardia abyssalis]MBW0137770.1 low temperature requirement protein A [Pseudonocardia abyssalis]
MATPRRARLETRDGLTTVTTLELFFDLVFVFALTQVTDLMADDPSAVGLFRGALILTVLWWCWVGYAWLCNVVKADEGVIRVAMFAAMGAMFVAAITIPESFDDLPGGLSGPVVFAACYFVVRAVHIVMFWLVSAGDPELRKQVLRFVPSMAIGTVLLLAASQTSGALQTWLWVAAIVGDYLGTLVAGTGWRLASAGHFAERHGLIVIVALGESIVATGIGIAQKPISWPIIAASTLALIVSAALWWAYFDVTAIVTEKALHAADGARQIQLARNGFSFLHLPMIIGIIMMSLGLKKALGHVAGDDDYTLADPLYGLPLVALFGGVALFLLAHVAFTRAVVGRTKWERVVAAGVLVALIPPSSMVPAIWTLVILAAVLVALLGFETRRYADERHEIRHATGH